MFIDTSAFVAIFANEPEAARFLRAIRLARNPITSGIVRLETAVVLATQKGKPPSSMQQVFDSLLAEIDIEVIALTDSMSRIAVAAYETFGKGRGHPAQLNLADALSYACAKAFDVPILFKGDDFAATDLKIAHY